MLMEFPTKLYDGDGRIADEESTTGSSAEWSCPVIGRILLIVFQAGAT
jgi:hypothetical protein